VNIISVLILNVHGGGRTAAASRKEFIPSLTCQEIAASGIFDSFLAKTMLIAILDPPS
jgi:hypothetical protein